MAFKRIGYRDGDAVGIDAVRLAIAIEPERGDDRDDVLGQQGLQQRGVHAFDFAGEQVVHALDDAHGMRDDDIGARGAQVIGGKPFEDFMGQPVRRRERELERRGIGHAGAVQVGGRDILFLGQGLNLRGRAMDQHHPDVQRAQHGNIQQQRREVFVRDNGAVHRENKGLLAELRNVLQDAPQVGQFHFSAK